MTQPHPGEHPPQFPSRSDGAAADAAPDLGTRAASALPRRSVLASAAGLAVTTAVAGNVTAGALTDRASAHTLQARGGADAIHTLGVGGGPVLNQVHHEPATVLSVDGHHYLIDCGSDTPRLLADSGLGFSKLRAVFITHHHLDHVGGVPTLGPTGWIYSPSPLQGHLSFYGPPELKKLVSQARKAMDHSIDLFGPPANPPFPDLRVHEIRPPDFRAGGPARNGIVKVMEDENVVVHACRVVHTDLVALAYRFTLKRSGKKVVVSGDRAPDGGAGDRVFAVLSREVDVLIHEAAALSQANAWHTDVAAIPGIAKSVGAKRVVLHHYVPPSEPVKNFASKARAAARQVGYRGKIVAAEDFDVIKI